MQHQSQHAPHGADRPHQANLCSAVPLGNGLYLLDTAQQNGKILKTTIEIEREALPNGYETRQAAPSCGCNKTSLKHNQNAGANFCRDFFEFIGMVVLIFCLMYIVAKVLDSFFNPVFAAE